MAVSGPAPLHGRHRDKNGEVSKKHGNTLVGTLRKTNGAEPVFPPFDARDPGRGVQLVPQGEPDTLVRRMPKFENGRLHGLVPGAPLRRVGEFDQPVDGR